MFHSEQNQKDYFQKNGRNDNIFAVIRIIWPKIAQETNKPFDLNNLLNYVSLNYRSFHMNVWYKMLMGPTTSFDLDDFWNCRSSNFMSSTVYLRSYLWEAAIQECSQKAIILKKIHRGVIFSITLLNFWSNSLKNACGGV